MRRLLRKPVRLVPLGFLAVILVGTGLLMLPWATSQQRYTPFVTALFTSTSAVSVTGMAVTDTPNYWNGFGLVMITVLTQIGGLGILTGASLVILAVSRQLGLRNRLLVQAETAEFGLGDVRRLLLRIAATVFVTEALMTAVIAARLFLAYDYRPGRALWSAVFHSVQAFNNGGFALYSDGLIAFSRDGWVALPLSVGAIIGGLGFPALFEAVREWRQPARWAVATKLTVWGSVVLTVFGVAYLLMAEWTNPFTIGTYDVPGKLLASFTQIALSRTGGFDVVNVGRLTDESYPMLIGLMFIGGGSASTAGGIKVSTFFLLGFAIWAELRGEPDTTVGRRRVAAASQRQALTRGAAERRARGRRDGRPDRVDLAGVVRRRVVRGHLRVQHHRPDRRGVRAALPARPVRADRAHVHRPDRAAHARLGHRVEHPSTAVPLPGGATHCRLDIRRRPASR